MTQDKAYIKITAPPGMAQLFASGEKRLNKESSKKFLERINPGHWAEFIRDTLDMAGDKVPDEAMREEEWAIETLMQKGRASADLMALQFQDSLGRIIEKSSKDLADTYQEDKDCFYLEYNPAEWFTHPHPAAPGHRPLSHFLSGRLFALSWTCVLDAHGFTVEGTGLEEEPEA